MPYRGTGAVRQDRRMGPVLAFSPVCLIALWVAVMSARDFFRDGA
jgi:hypothetical protein